METRIIKTKLWRDGKVHKLSKDATYLFVYLLSCEYINLCGLFELPDKYIELDTKLTNKELQSSKSELQNIKICYFYEGWIYLPHTTKHNKYHKSPKTMVAFKNQLDSIPKSIKDKFKEIIDSTMDSSIDSTILTDTNYNKHSTMDSVSIPIENINKKTENINNKTKYINKKQEILKKIDMNENINPEDIPF